MCLLIVDSDGSLSIDCVNCSQKHAHVSTFPENGWSLIGGNLSLADGGIGAVTDTASRASMIVTFAVESARGFSI
jgi:lipid-binding SYLF domain-containing protein